MTDYLPEPGHVAHRWPEATWTVEARKLPLAGRSDLVRVRRVRRPDYGDVVYLESGEAVLTLALGQARELAAALLAAEAWDVEGAVVERAGQLDVESGHLTVEVPGEDELIHVYAAGPTACGVCSPLPLEGATERLNEEYPSGTDGGWQPVDRVRDVSYLQAGPCQLVEGRSHYLFEAR